MDPLQTDWSYIGAVAFAIAMAAYFMFSYRRKLNNQRLGQAIDTCIDTIYRLTYAELRTAEDRSTASRLAGCAVNELFGFEPPSEEARRFATDNRSRVQAMVHRLTENHELRPLAAATVHYLSKPPLSKRMKQGGGLMRATKMGLVDPTEKPLPVHRFLAETAKLHRRAVTESDALDQAEKS